jgi:methionine aminotransferase
MEWPSKLPLSGNTIFTVMSKMAQEYQAVNLGQGFPDYPMNSLLVERVSQAMKAGFNQYSPMAGSVKLREVLSKKIASLYGTIVNPVDQITIVPGATYGIYTALTTILKPGDEVIVFDPTYDSYIPNILANGAVAVPIPMNYPEYTINWALVEASVNINTRAIIINNPHNPTGAVLSKEDIAALRAIVHRHQLIIIADEVYEHIVFDKKEHESILKYPDLLECSYVIFSFGKVFDCTGWKLGYVVSSPDAMLPFRQLHQFLAFACNTPMQEALAAHLETPDHYLGLSDFMQQKKDYFQNLMAQTSFKPLYTGGSFFQCYSYAHLSDEKDTEFVQRLVKEYGVATIPLSPFYSNQEDRKVIRFCFAKENSTLEKAVERLKGV